MFYMQGYELSCGVVGMLEGFCIVPVGPLLVWQPYLSPCSRGWIVPYPSTSVVRRKGKWRVGTRTLPAPLSPLFKGRVQELVVSAGHVWPCVACSQLLTCTCTVLPMLWM